LIIIIFGLLLRMKKIQNQHGYWN